MKVYHGGEMPLPNPIIDFSKPGRTTDFGSGFYATTSFEQAVRWVRYKLDQGMYQSGCVSCYELPDNILQDSDIKVRRFDGADRDWLDFVVMNRKSAGFDHGFDLVYGPVANDRVFATITMFEMDLLDAQSTIDRLRAYKFVDQFLFHSEAALRRLRFVGSESVR